MGYVWTETISVNADIEDTNIDEIRTHINTERVDRAGLAAYTWTNAELEGDEVAQSEIAELRTATDEAYDLLLTCASHYSSDDATHYGSNNSTHDSSVDATHYSTHEATHYTTDDGDHDGTHYATHDVTAEATHYGTHYPAYYASRKSGYFISYQGTADG